MRKEDMLGIKKTLLVLCFICIGYIDFLNVQRNGYANKEPLIKKDKE
jgi:hypothetical protein